MSFGPSPTLTKAPRVQTRFAFFFFFSYLLSIDGTLGNYMLLQLVVTCGQKLRLMTGHTPYDGTDSCCLPRLKVCHGWKEVGLKHGAIGY